MFELALRMRCQRVL